MIDKHLDKHLDGTVKLSSLAVVVQFEFSWALNRDGHPCHTWIMPRGKSKAKPKPKLKPKPAKRPPREDFNQAAFRAVQETIRRSES